MLKQDNPSDILDFWLSIEQFTPPEVEISKCSGPLKSIQQEVLGDKHIPWLNRKVFKHYSDEDNTWVYTVFIGIMKRNDIVESMRSFLGIDEQVSGKDDDSVSCICTFKLDINGRIKKETYQITNYALNMSCLKQLSLKQRNEDVWSETFSRIKQQCETTFVNFCDTLNQNNSNRIVQYEDLYELLSDHLSCLEWIEFEYLRNEFVIHSNYVKIPKGKNNEAYEPSNQEMFLDFYSNDLINIKKQFNNSKGQDISEGLKAYLGMNKCAIKEDLCQDHTLLNKYISPKFLPPIRWPGPGNYPLSIMQQIAVNLALKEKSGMFAINGPPGTGKTTLVKDIIAGIVLERSKILSKLEKVDDAFTESSNDLNIGTFNFRVWRLKPELLGHEIVIASSNNGAIENISKEIPKAEAIDDQWHLDYFAEIMSNLSEKDQSSKHESGKKEFWGLAAAPLGNNKNRYNFFQNFWFLAPNPELKNDACGLKYLLSQKQTSNWKKAKQNFNDALAKYRQKQSELIKLEQIIDELPIKKIELKKMEKRIDSEKAKLYELQSNATEVQQKILKQESSKRNAEKAIERRANDKIKYEWLKIIISIFFKNSQYNQLQNKINEIHNKIDKIDEQIEIYQLTLDQLNNACRQQEIYINNQTKEIDDFSAALKNDQSFMLSYKGILSSNFPDQNFWQQSDVNNIYLSSPWLWDELHEIRAELFIHAFDLHKSFIINASSKMIDNLNCMHQCVNFSWSEKNNYLLPHIWASFFLVVPVVSTTFASVAKIYNRMGFNSIAWLLIDEAGQAMPQAAVGAIYRARRSIVLGDPMQIRPVSNTPLSMNNVLKCWHNVSDLYDVTKQSAQTIADRVNTYGTYIDNDGNKMWLGSPLLVHRRCSEPMFSVANEIAYDNLMIQATKNKDSDIQKVFPVSQWIHLEGGKADGHWLPSEGDIVMDILRKITTKLRKLPSLYIITPFKNVSQSMKAQLKSNKKLWCNNTNAYYKDIELWVKNSVGTIHTFQGKQAEAVILLLGGNPKQQGAIIQMSKLPNVLNVAITRAKNLVLIIGNRNLWSKQAYFQNLSQKVIHINGEDYTSFKNADAYEDEKYVSIFN